jgi:hypothetical protein
MTLSWPRPGIPNVELGREGAEVGLGLGLGPIRSPRSSLQRSVISVTFSPAAMGTYFQPSLTFAYTILRVEYAPFS